MRPIEPASEELHSNADCILKVDDAVISAALNNEPSTPPVNQPRKSKSSVRTWILPWCIMLAIFGIGNVYNNWASNERDHSACSDFAKEYGIYLSHVAGLSSDSFLEYIPTLNFPAKLREIASRASNDLRYALIQDADLIGSGNVVYTEHTQYFCNKFYK